MGVILRFYSEKGSQREVGPFPFGVVVTGREIREPLEGDMVAFLDRRSDRWMLASKYEDFTPYLLAIMPGVQEAEKVA